MTPQELITGYSQGELDEAQTQELIDWIKADHTNAVEFVKATSLHGYLRNHLVGQLQVSDWQDEATGCAVSEAEPSKSKTPRNRAAWFGLALAASLVLAAGVWISQQEKPSTQAIARLAQVMDVQWADGVARSAGTQLASQHIRIESGLLRIDFNNGVVMTLSGPASLRIESDMRTHLAFGAVTVKLPSEISGFEVLTDSMQVRDLGTAFGISVQRDSGKAELAVFDGSVEVTAVDETQQSATITVDEGDAVAATPDSQPVDIDYDTRKYDRPWALACGILNSSGIIKYASPGPQENLTDIIDRDHFLLSLEADNVVLSGPVRVDMSEPSKSKRKKVPAHDIVINSSCQSFLLQFHPDARFGKNRAVLKGAIEFENPIKGVIFRTSTLMNSDPLVGVPERTYKRPYRGLEQDDRIWLSEDRRTLHLNTRAASRPDHVRVFVQ